MQSGRRTTVHISVITQFSWFNFVFLTVQHSLVLCCRGSAS